MNEMNIVILNWHPTTTTTASEAIIQYKECCFRPFIIPAVLFVVVVDVIVIRKQNQSITYRLQVGMLLPKFIIYKSKRRKRN